MHISRTEELPQEEILQGMSFPQLFYKPPFSFPGVFFFPNAIDKSLLLLQNHTTDIEKAADTRTLISM